MWGRYDKACCCCCFAALQGMDTSNKWDACLFKSSIVFFVLYTAIFVGPRKIQRGEHIPCCNMCRQMMHKQLLFSMQFVRVSRTTVVGQDAVDAVHQQVEVEALFLY